MNYLEALNQLYQISELKGIKFDLTNSLKLQQALNFPERSFSCVHVAGTNGKGSVCHKIAKGLELAGFLTGLYTSPHLFCFRERIQINFSQIKEKEVATLLPLLFKLTQTHAIRASFFELTTFLAFLYFKKQAVDWSVIETGLGGRLDATNVLEAPKLSVITSISRDHTEILGDTLEKITEEKAGILKQGCPILIGPRVPKAPILKKAKSLNCPLYEVKGEFASYDLENQAIAKAALELLHVPNPLIEQALSCRPPCRMEEIAGFSPPIIFDVAHNTDGIDKLFKALKLQYPNYLIRVVCGFSSSKEMTLLLKTLSKEATALHLVSSNHPRLAPLEQLKQLAEHANLSSPLFFHQTIQEGVLEAIRLAKHKQELTLVCGSFFIMNEAKMALRSQ